MPRVVKAISGGGAKKPAGAKRNTKMYSMPEKIKEGTILVDLAKCEWRIGPSIGTGGFGEIYSACRVGEKNFDYVVKCEPHSNGPLFVEMHFYMRNARRDDIERFKEQNNLKTLGMPFMIGSGSADIKGQKHRFIVMPRYGNDISKDFIANGRRLPETTIYRLVIQMLDVYEFVHSCGYVHADLKAANILRGYGKNDRAQAYLVDFGLASHYTTKEFKPDPKKMHNGTIEYTSRDAHLGVPTMRADLEILAYNIIDWMGVQLPWVRDNLLAAPVKVQKAKEDFMDNLSTHLKKLFPKGIPVPLDEFMKYVAKMAFNEKPNYNKCRMMFTNALRLTKAPLNGVLEFNFDKDNNNVSPSTSRAKKRIASPKRSPLLIDSSTDMICASDDDDDDVITEKEPNRACGRTARKLKTQAGVPKRTEAIIGKSPVKSPRKSPVRRNRRSGSSTSASSPSPFKAASRHRISPGQKNALHSPLRKKLSKLMPSKSKSNDNDDSLNSTPDRNPLLASSSIKKTKATLNFNPSVGLSVGGRPGKTVINDHLTPNARASKTYEFNFELDVSMDANVVVNVKRKKKEKSATVTTPLQNNTPTSKIQREATQCDVNNEESTPQKRVKVHKLDNLTEKRGSNTSSPRTPTVTVKKMRR